MKKTFIALMALTLLPLNAWAAFTDVDASNPFFDAINWVEKEGIVEGYQEDNTYRWQNTINRYEFVTIIVRSVATVEEIESCDANEHTFYDVEVDWPRQFVCVARKEGWISGYDDDGGFHGPNEINAVEAFKIISEALDLDRSSATSIWYESYVRSLDDINAIPIEIKSFDKLLTRGEMAEIIYRVKAGVGNKPSQTFESLSGDGFISDPKGELAFYSDGLFTNTSIRSIALEEVVGGGPKKDGIPALFNPGFENVVVASEWLNDESLGIFYQNRFYPYAILVWHEVVNDVIGEQNIAVTFCPLCGSAVVFDRNLKGETLTFGVSGKLWESNLLMYNHGDESLWSQITGRAVVGRKTGNELTVLDADVLTFGQVKSAHPNAQVLSRETGHNRAYGESPYGDYDTNDRLYFDVSSTDDAFPLKTLFIISNQLGTSFGFHRADLLQTGQTQLMVDGNNIEAKVLEDGTIEVKNLNNDQIIPTYTAMWFSWVTHVQENKAVWSLGE